MFKILPCIDSVEMAASRRQELDIPRNVAAELGRSAVEAAVEGQYVYGDGRKVDWSQICTGCLFVKGKHSSGRFSAVA